MELKLEEATWCNDKFKADLRNRSSEVRFLNTDELSTVSSDLWTDID